MSEVAFNWLLGNTKQIGQPDELNLLKSLVAQTFIEGSNIFGYEFSATNEIPSGQSHQVLMGAVLMNLKNGFSICCDCTRKENTIDPMYMDGAGEILPEHGYVPILMLVALQRKLNSAFPKLDKPLLSFCDEQGEAIDFNQFDSFRVVVDKFGFDKKSFFKDAEKLNLVAEVIELDEIDSEQENMFFN